MPAGADPDLTMQLAKAVADLYGDAQQRLLELVARRLARGVDQPGWAEAKLLEVSGLHAEARKVVDRLDRLGPGAIDAAFGAAFDEGLRQGAAELAEAGVVGDLAPVTNRRAVEALARETVAAVRSTHGQILRAVDDGYRRVIAEASLPDVVTGSGSRRQATQRALDRFADQGVTGFTDTAGRRWQLDSYAEMATRTGSGQAQVAGTLERFRQQGRDLVIVSDAPQECKACRPWEGKVLSISGEDDRFPSLSEARGEGLLHANCRHRLGAYIEGHTKPFTHTADPDGDRARQQQRHIERQVRQWKRREMVALDEPAKLRARAKVTEWQGRLDEHVKANDLKRLRYRESVGGYKPTKPTANPTPKAPAPKPGPPKPGEPVVNIVVGG